MSNLTTRFITTMNHEIDLSEDILNNGRYFGVTAKVNKERGSGLHGRSREHSRGEVQGSVIQ